MTQERRFTTQIKVEFFTSLGDSFDKSNELTQKEIDEQIEEHIDDWCAENNIEREYVKIIEKVEE